MTKINEYININKQKPVEIVHELKGDEYKIPSFEEFMKDYESDGNLNYDDLSGGSVGEVKGCGPCHRCEKGNGGSGINGQHAIHRLNSKFGDKTKNYEKDISLSPYDISVKASFGIGGAIASGEIDNSIYKYKDDKGEVKFGSSSLGGEIGAGLGGVTASYSANADLMSIKVDGIQTRIGFDVGSGFTAGSDGVEVKGLGLGISVGKKMGISTPLGGFSVDTEEACVVQ